MDKGPWTVSNREGDVRIDSGDFTHDASLIVYGDFRDTKTKVQYARFIAKLLNYFVGVADVSKEVKGGRSTR